MAIHACEDSPALPGLPPGRKQRSGERAFTCPEFTSLCPVTGRPDFAHLVIDYAPHHWLVESKSLEPYLASFRNHRAFDEDCTIASACEPGY